jgi:hypothetical protein
VDDVQRQQCDDAGCPEPVKKEPDWARWLHQKSQRTLVPNQILRQKLCGDTAQMWCKQWILSGLREV